jgi:hypothetical protein
MKEIRRSSDGELEGFTRACDVRGFEALTVFHGLLGTTATESAARALVHERGLGSLAEHWYWRSRATGRWAVVLPQEVRPGLARVRVGYYAIPGSPVSEITFQDLLEGDVLTLQRPDEAVEGMPE